MPKHVVFDGGYTIESAGDDAPLAFLSYELRRVYGENIRLSVLSRHPNGDFNKYYDVTTYKNIEYRSKSESLEKWFCGLNYNDDRHELAKIADLIADADLLVLGAGNFLTEIGIDVLRGHLPRFGVMMLMANMAHTPCMLFGLSANKLQSPYSIRAAQWILSNAQAVTFREQKAIDNLIASGVSLPSYELLPDPALGAPRSDSSRADEILSLEGIPQPKGYRLALAPRDLSWLGKNENYHELMAGLINRWLDHNLENDVLFVPQCTYCVDSKETDDRWIAEQISRQSNFVDRIHHVNGLYPSWDVEVLYETATVAVATRLHGSVFAARRSTPVIGIAYEDKVSGFFHQLGMPEFVLPLDIDVDSLFLKVIELLQNEAEISAHLTSNVLRMQKQLGRYTDIAIKLLESETLK